MEKKKLHVRILHRMLALLCAFALAVAVLPMLPAFAEGETSGECGAEGSMVRWFYTAATETLTIYGTGEMTDWQFSYVENSTPWGSYAGNIKTISIRSGITGIGNSAFNGCSNVTSVTIPDSVTSIGDMAFWGCRSLPKVTIPDSVTSIGYNAFFDCISLASVTIPNSVTSIGRSAFQNCSGLIGVMIPNSVTSIEGWTFCGCSSLMSVTIPDSVIAISGWAFNGCSSLTSVTIPASVETIENGVFSNCSNLNAFIVDAGNTRYYAENGFLYARGSEAGHDAIMQAPPRKTTGAFEIPDGIAIIVGGSFAGCADLTSVTIPASVTLIGGNAFQGCTNLETITFEGNAPEFRYAAFGDVTATAYYPAGNATWTEAMRQQYGGTLTWKEMTSSGLGDVTGDGKVTVGDLVKIKRYILGLDKEINKDAADVNKDGKITVGDLVKVKRYILKLDTTLE